MYLCIHVAKIFFFFFWKGPIFISFININILNIFFIKNCRMVLPKNVQGEGQPHEHFPAVSRNKKKGRKGVFG